MTSFKDHIRYALAESGGIYTDVWLDGAYTRIPFKVEAPVAFQMVRDFRKQVNNK